MRVYRVVRDADPSGVSGTGPIGELVQFSDGTVVMRWLTRLRSTALYDSLEAFVAIHGHDGQTRVVELEAVR